MSLSRRCGATRRCNGGGGADAGARAGEGRRDAGHLAGEPGEARRARGDQTRRHDPCPPPGTQRRPPLQLQVRRSRVRLLPQQCGGSCAHCPLGVAADGWEGGRAGTLSPARAGFQRAWCAMLTVRPTSSPLRRTRSTSWRCTRRARPASWPGVLAPLQRGEGEILLLTSELEDLRKQVKTFAHEKEFLTERIADKNNSLDCKDAFIDFQNSKANAVGLALSKSAEYNTNALRKTAPRLEELDVRHYFRLTIELMSGVSEELMKDNLKKS